MAGSKAVTVRMYGLLHTVRKKQGLSDSVQISVPSDGRSAMGIALDLELPLEKIEAVFCNHVTYGLDHVIHPGDEVAFVPQGVPGPHRFLLGIHQKGRKGRS